MLAVLFLFVVFGVLLGVIFPMIGPEAPKLKARASSLIAVQIDAWIRLAPFRFWEVKSRGFEVAC